MSLKKVVLQGAIGLGIIAGIGGTSCYVGRNILDECNNMSVRSTRQREDMITGLTNAKRFIEPTITPQMQEEIKQTERNLQRDALYGCAFVGGLFIGALVLRSYLTRDRVYGASPVVGDPDQDGRRAVVEGILSKEDYRAGRRL